MLGEKTNLLRGIADDDTTTLDLHPSIPGDYWLEQTDWAKNIGGWTEELSNQAAEIFPELHCDYTLFWPDGGEVALNYLEGRPHSQERLDARHNIARTGYVPSENKAYIDWQAEYADTLKALEDNPDMPPGNQLSKYQVDESPWSMEHMAPEILQIYRLEVRWSHPTYWLTHPGISLLLKRASYEAFMRVSNKLSLDCTFELRTPKSTLEMSNINLYSAIPQCKGVNLYNSTQTDNLTCFGTPLPYVSIRPFYNFYPL
jgi:hypothetical protein